MKTFRSFSILIIILSMAMSAWSQDAPKKMEYHDPGLQKVVQVAIVVKDIEASSKLWAELLDMPVPKITTTRPGPEVSEIYRGKPSEGQVKLTFF